MAVSASAASTPTGRKPASKPVAVATPIKAPPASAKKKTTLPNKVTAVFEQVKETKGAYQYREIDPKTRKELDMVDSKIGSIYLRKNALAAAFGDNVPETIVVTVTVEE